MTEDLDLLKRERAKIKSKLTRFQTFLDSFTEDKLSQLEIRFDDVNHEKDKFEQIQDKIELLDQTEIGKLEFENFEEKFYEVVGVARNIIKDSSQQIQAQIIQGGSSSNSSKPNVRLPIMDLPKFDGDYEKWEHFRDMFVALVHDDTSVDNIRKFYYLTSALTGAAAKVIKSIKVTNDNYQVAWDLLKSRFEDTEIIIRNHVKALVEMPSVENNSKFNLRELTDDIQAHVRSLTTLGEPVDQWDTLLIYIIWKKLDWLSQNQWEVYLNTKCIKHPSFADLVEFLNERCQLLEKQEKVELPGKPKNQMQSNFEKPSKHEKVSKFYNVRKHVSNHVTKPNYFCHYCKGSHNIYFCEKFKSLPVVSRLSEIKQLKLCNNCLRSNHSIQDCISTGCKKCSKKHNTLLHIENAESENQRVTNNNKSETSSGDKATVSGCVNTVETEVSSVLHAYNRQKSHILLSTAVVYIQDVHGNWLTCRALLDSGSQPNFITRALSNKLGFSQFKTNIPISGVGESSTKVLYRTQAQIKSVSSDFTVTLTFLILDKITERLPTVNFDKSDLKIPSDITLADEHFNKQDMVDILIGAEIFYDLLQIGQIKLGVNLPLLQNTLLGWIVSGSMPFKAKVENRTVSNVAVNQEMYFDLENFWRIEECTVTPCLTEEDQYCEENFIQTTKRDAAGKFSVTLPIKKNIGAFGNSVENAKTRLYAMERKFKKNTEFKNLYHAFMQEYEQLGHMTKLTDDQVHSTDLSNTFYLPHHGVINADSSTTKLRVVFDGSCKSDSGISLNDKLLVGPTIQEDLFSILIRFRKHTYALTADIAKMYRQVLVDKEYRDYQRIVWRTDPSQPLQHYQLNTVTYGTASAAYLAIRSLKQVAIDIQKDLPEVSQIIETDFYVDDLLSGSSSVEGAINLKRDITNILSGYGMELRKWLSNDIGLLQKSKFDSNDSYHIVDDDTKKTLGLWWQAEVDTFKYNIDFINFSEINLTKRMILSAISKLFDPLGFLSPVIIRAKIMLQKLWQCKLNWDDPLPSDFIRSWLEFSKNLPEIKHIQIPRLVLVPDSKRVEIHGFSDASESAYGACIYLRSISSTETVTVKLLCSKSRVAPIKSLSLPRLELCGALLLVRLYNKIAKALNIETDKTYFWTDSTIVLSWLASPPNTWKVFVANRVTEIQTSTEFRQWSHVCSEDNPADLVSRGVDPKILISHALWWNGPSWLHLESSDWPKSKFTLDSKTERRKSKIASFAVTLNNFDIFARFSSLYRLQRIIALCLRFRNNCLRSRDNRTYGDISVTEIDNSMKVLIRTAQADDFSRELSNLQRGKPLAKDSKLLSLKPFIDADHLIRVGGRISKSNLATDTKYQIVLPQKHLLTKLIIINEHYRQLHAGTQTLLYSLRQKYWPVNGRTTIRNVLRKCIVCFRNKPSPLYRQMGDLPAQRVTQYRPFYVTGIDFAGPFLIKDGRLRNRSIVKAYLCIFICFATKAVHLEAVSDLTSASFLSTLTRFVSRRGLCKMIYSDNATNFVGARNELRTVVENLCKTVKERSIIDFLIQNQIDWKFIPPNSPHQGGLWEAAVKTAKYHITRVVGDLRLTFEDLVTVFSRVEAIMNSRPITPLSEDPADLTALTPGHFLIGDSLLSLPETDFTEIPVNRIKHYQLLQRIGQHFWQRWSHEYLTTIQQRTKWKENGALCLSVGDLVILKEDNTPPQHWRLGRVVELHPGSDGITRVASVKTGAGVFQRVVQKLCKLPVDTN